MLDIAIEELERLIDNEKDEYKRFDLKMLLEDIIISKKFYESTINDQKEYTNRLKEQINELIKTNYTNKKDS